MAFSDGKKIVFSGMQATGIPSLGNYIGAIKNWIALQDEYNCLYCVVDMHSITVRQDPAALRQKARELLMLYIALGVDPDKSVIYYQSHVPAHAELAWILNCFTYVGELNRMTQFKEKSQKHDDNINAGLMTYPVLMAADILLFQTDLVPVGDDQRQHLELCRDVAIRFNNLFGSVFTVPEAFIGKEGARIKSLQEPDKKMSKSESVNKNNVIFLLDKPDVIMSKFKKAVTDSGNEVRYAADKPGVSNLLEIYCACTGQTIAEAEREFEGKGYGAFKSAVGESVVEALRPVQETFERLAQDKGYIDTVIKNGSEKANSMAARTLKKTQKKVGFPI